VAVVALVGRPNVGKSRLFNRIIGQRRAIVHDVPGVTRDRLYAAAAWRGYEFDIVDTGGIGFDDDRPLGDLMAAQAAVAVAEADVIVLVVDARAGLSPKDEEVADLLRRSRKPIVVAANKAEGAAAAGAAEFWSLGLGEPFPVSAEHGEGVGDLLDAVVERLPAATGADAGVDAGGAATDAAGAAGATDATNADDAGEAPGEDAALLETPLAVAVVGRPNVGKSSLINALLGAERVIVTPTPGTTRDAIDVLWQRPGGRPFLFIDTAGLRRRTRVEEPIERFGVLRALRAIDRSDVAVLVIDGAAGVTDQERKIASYVLRQGRAAVVAVSKCDLVADLDPEKWREAIRTNLSFLAFAPVLFVSALTGRGIAHLPGVVARCAEHHATRIPTPSLNRIVQRAVTGAPAPTRGGRSLKVYYAAQVASRPPAFALLVNYPDLVTDPFRRFLDGRLREALPLEGTPVRFLARERRRSPSLTSKGRVRRRPAGTGGAARE